MHSVFRALLLALACAGAPTTAPAQSRPGLVSFQQAAMPDDVPAHLSTALAQDASGMLWIGTQDGLVRYDGYHYKVFRNRSGDSTSLSGSYVRSLLVARDGRLWVGTISGGLSVFDPRTERFTQYRHDAARPDSLANDRVEGIAEGADGQLWLATDGGLDRLDPASGKFTHLRPGAGAGSLASEQVRALLLDRQGRLWVGTRAGLQRWLEGERFSAPLSGAHITRLLQDSQGRIWAGTARDGAFVLEPASGKLQRLAGLGHYWIYSMAEAQPGEMWLGTFGAGIDVVDGASLQVVDRLRQDGSASMPGNDRIGALLADRAGLVWAGTWGGGLAHHDPATRAFGKLRHSSTRPDGPSHPAIVRAMEMADGTLWLGTNGNGIDILDSGGHLRDAFRPAPKQPGALADGSVTCLAQAADGTAWVATLDGTLHRLRPGQRRFERITTAQGLPGGPIRAMVFGSDGALWAGALNGLARIDPASGRITAYTHRPDDATTLSGREVEALAFTPDGTLWVGTDHGLNAFDTASGKAVRILREAGRSDSLPDNWVPDLMVARDGRLWLATQAGAAILDKWDGQHASFDVLGPRLKLPPHPPESLLEDAQGQVWLGSRVRIDPASWQWRSFERADGNEFRTLYFASRARTRSGALLFGSPEGLLVVQPQQLRSWDYQPHVTATALAIEGVDQPGAGALAARRLEPGQRNLRLEFAALDLSAPDKLRYRYKLDGYDADWNPVDARQRVAAYTHLPPGEYTLRIQASNRAGLWSPHEYKLAVHVVPAFYQTVWFRIALWLLGALAVFGLFRLRLRQLRRRSARLELVVAERTAALEGANRRLQEASLSDPLTGLRNRRFLEQAIQADLDLAARRHSAGLPGPDADLLLFMLDLDHFKQVNDVYGHAAGDAVLVQTAALLRQCLRASDYVVRWGGEEFLLVARFVDRQQGPQLAEKIRSTVAAHAFALPDGRVLHKTVSIGFAAFPFVAGQPLAVSPGTLQRIADTALYAAKKSWRDAWVGVQAGSNGDAHALAHFLDDAPAAVAAGDVELLLPPTRSGAIQWQ